VPAAADARCEGPVRDSQLKLLTIRPGAIGDCIVSLPALEHLRADYKEVWVSGPNISLVRFADRVRSIASTGLDLVGFEGGLGARGLAELAQFDSIVSWYGANRPEFRQAVSHLPFVFHNALPRDGSIHAVDFYMRPVGGPDGAVPGIPCPREKRGFIAIHPFSGSPAKNWPLDKYRALAQSLNRPVQFCAGPEERLDDAVRFDNLYEVALWLASAHAYVGNDSGISHLAAAVGTPVIAIFRTTDRAVWAPRGPAVTVLHEPDVEQVRAAVEALC
jgi:heptosyltransferase III